jgi:hypothetical protein
VFQPEHVFDDLYRDLCHAAWGIHGHPDPGHHCTAIRDSFIGAFSHMSPQRSSLVIRRGALMRFGVRWSGWELPTACLFCLCRLAEHQLPCRHAICDTCVTIFGRPTCGVEYHQDLVRCPLCQKPSQLTVRQLPPTKRPVVVTLDGGGIRGMITLGLLRALERRLAGAVTTVAEIPDLIAGPSVGTYRSHIFRTHSAVTSCGDAEASTAVLMRGGQVL